MTHGTPTWRVDKDREQLEDECEERARGSVEGFPYDGAELNNLLAGLDENEQEVLADAICDLLKNTHRPVAVHAFRRLLRNLAYRRALAVERRREGLPE